MDIFGYIGLKSEMIDNFGVRFRGASGGYPMRFQSQ
jgi:hypothetical protein